MKLVPAGATRSIARVILKSKKNSPTIYFGLGVAGAIGSAVLACRATLKLDETLDEIEHDRQESIDAVKHRRTVSDSEHGKLMIGYYARSAVKLGKLYGPSVALGAVSIGALTGSHVQLNKRNRNLSLAFAGLTKAYDEYRTRVAEEIGEEREKAIHQGQLNTAKNAKGGVKSLSPGELSPYRFYFDRACPEWQPEPAMNLAYLNALQEWWNHKLRVRGHVFMNEVLNSIGIDHTPEGALVGWIYGSDGGDNQIDFGIFCLTENISFQEGETANIWLDFNVDGEIYQLI